MAQPWETEPDRAEWADEATGLDCLILRVSHSGHLCGYVRVPEGHPLHGKNYSERVLAPAGIESRKMGNQGALPVLIEAMRRAKDGDDGTISLDLALSVHGSVTFTGELRGEDGWWVGFDCAHCDDLCPVNVGREFFGDGEYRDMAYVRRECERLSFQIAHWGQP